VHAGELRDARAPARERRLPPEATVPSPRLGICRVSEGCGRPIGQAGAGASACGYGVCADTGPDRVSQPARPRRRADTGPDRVSQPAGAHRRADTGPDTPSQPAGAHRRADTGSDTLSQPAGAHRRADTGPDTLSQPPGPRRRVSRPGTSFTSQTGHILNTWLLLGLWSGWSGRSRRRRAVQRGGHGRSRVRRAVHALALSIGPVTSSPSMATSPYILAVVNRARVQGEPAEDSRVKADLEDAVWKTQPELQRSVSPQGSRLTGDPVPGGHHR